MKTIEFLQQNWGTIATILFLASELLGTSKKVKENSIYQLIVSLLKKTQK